MCQDFQCDQSRKFQCLNNKCIPLWQICNNEDDCGDGSDENNHTLCKRWPVPCFSNQFKCANDKCISHEQVCDHNDDCGDLSDEKGCHQGKCMKEDRGGCQHNCTTLPSGGYICTCPTGYKVDHNNTKHCIDIDECSMSPGPNCSQICINMEGGFRCACSPGFELFDDRCVAAGERPFILFSNGPEIRSLESNYQHQSAVIAGESRIQSIDYDPVSGTFFFLIPQPIDVPNDITLLLDRSDLLD